MPKTRKDDMIAFENPFDSENLTMFNRQNAVIKAMDVMLDTFQDGMDKKNSSIDAWKVLYQNGVSLNGWTTPLKKLGFLKKNGADPTVDEVIELGRHVKIMAPNGTVRDFSSMFFDGNPTVEMFREKEKSLEKNQKRYGNILLGYMGLFLTGKKDERFKNTVVGYDAMHPGDTSDYQAYIEMPDGSRKVVTDLESKAQRDKILDELEPVEPAFKAFRGQPVLPKAPVERNVFRRFFAWIGIAKHSKEYLRADNEYQEARRKLKKYNEAKAAYDKIHDVAKKDELWQKTEEQMHKVNKHFEAGASDLARVRRKLTDVKTLENIVRSNAACFSKGSVTAMLDIIRNRPIVAEEVKDAKANADVAKDIENLKKYGQLAKDVYVDDTPVDDVNKFVTLVNPKKADQAAEDAEKAGPDMRHETFNNLAKEEYAKMVDSAKTTFENSFNLKCSPVNVQAVVDAFKLDEYVKYGLKNIDNVDYNPSMDKLPPVNDRNLGDMTLLLMSGVKTVAIKGNLVELNPEKHFNKRPMLADHPADLQPQDPQPQDPQNTL